MGTYSRACQFCLQKRLVIEKSVCIITTPLHFPIQTAKTENVKSNLMAPAATRSASARSSRLRLLRMMSKLMVRMLTTSLKG